MPPDSDLQVRPKCDNSGCDNLACLDRVCDPPDVIAAVPLFLCATVIIGGVIALRLGRESRIARTFEPTKGQRLAGLFAIPVIVAGAVITTGVLLRLSIFRSDVDNSRKREVVGCYFIGNSLAAKVDYDRITSAGISSPYDVIPYKAGLAILPTVLLQAKMSGSTWQIVKADGPKEYLLASDDGHPSLIFLTSEGQEVRASKRQCR